MTVSMNNEITLNRTDCLHPTICKRSNVPTFLNKVREEVIDLTLTTNKEGLVMENWRVGFSFLDYRRIFFWSGLQEIA